MPRVTKNTRPRTVRGNNVLVQPVLSLALLHGFALCAVPKTLICPQTAQEILSQTFFCCCGQLSRFLWLFNSRALHRTVVAVCIHHAVFPAQYDCVERCSRVHAQGNEASMQHGDAGGVMQCHKLYYNSTTTVLLLCVSHAHFEFLTKWATFCVKVGRLSEARFRLQRTTDSRSSTTSLRFRKHTSFKGLRRRLFGAIFPSRQYACIKCESLCPTNNYQILNIKY